MEQYINKDAVVAEIERRIEENKKEIQRVTDKYLKGYFEGYENALVLFKKQFLDTVNTAEIKYYKGIEIKIERYINKKHPQYNYVGFTARQGEKYLNAIFHDLDMRLMTEDELLGIFIKHLDNFIEYNTNNANKVTNDWMFKGIK